MPETTREKNSGHKLTAEMLTMVGSSLVEIDWRLLHWLLRYPLQRADDLAVGVARWASRATVYRHLQELEANALVEWVVPKTPGTGKRLHYLSNLGLYLLAKHLEQPGQDLAHCFQADEAGLLRWLPRLSALLLLQEVVNGLITHTAEAMARQGRRPGLVRWTWRRDLVHRFCYREQAMRFFADGSVALCIRAQHTDGSLLDQWYGLFLLSSELDDERLMRLRLERLLCWRESPERWPIYQHMPMVLLLARSPRQREHWQHAGEASALSLRLEPLQGALACLPAPLEAQVNPWRLDWLTLATEMPCRLPELLTPLPSAAFPSALGLEEGEDAAKGGASSPSQDGDVVPSCGTHARPHRLIVRNLAHRASHPLPRGSKEREVIALLGLKLTPGQWGILHLLLAHPLLSDEEMAALLSLQRGSVRSSLYALHAQGCLEPVVTSAGKRWRLCERGLHLFAAANHMHIRSIAVTSDEEAELGRAPIVQRGERWLLLRIQHTAGIYGFFAALAQAAKCETEQALRWWETGASCERRYRVGEHWYNLRPDALAEYSVGQSQFRFWLEWDRGTMNVRDLAVKFRSYAHYLASREWASERTAAPGLLVVAPEVAQERRMQRVAQAVLAHVSGLVIWTTTEVLLHEHGPLAPIWTRGLPLPHNAALPEDAHRRRVFGTISQENA